MLSDLSTSVPLIVSILGALGVATVIGQWFASGKDRRASRAAVLIELAAVESARWHQDGGDVDNPRLRDATRKLETAALIARIPRRAFVQYAQLAQAALWYTENEVATYGGDPDAASLPTDFYEVVQEAAAVVSSTAWSSPATRWLWLRWRLRRLSRASDALTDTSVRLRITRAREKIR